MNRLISLFVLSFAILGGSASVANEFDLLEIPPLRPLRLLVSQLDRDHHIMLAREERGGNHYLIINDNGRVYSPELEQHSVVYFDGGTADLYLKSGERYLIPSSSGGNYLNTTLGPTIIFRDQAPTPLQDLEIDDQQLSRLGFKSFIAPAKEPRRGSRRADDDYAPLQNLEQMVVVRIQLKKGTGNSEKSEVEEKLKGLDPAQVRFLERENSQLYGTAAISLLAVPEAIDTVKAQFPEGVLARLDTFNPKNFKPVSDRPLSKKQMDRIVGTVLANQEVPLSRRLRVLNDLKASSDVFEQLSAAQKVRLIQAVFDVLGDLDQIHSQILYLAQYDTAVSGFAAGLRHSVGTTENMLRTENHILKDLMLAPIREAGRIGYEILDKVNHPIARQVVVETSHAIHGAGMSLLSAQPFGKEHSYFREWLNQQRESFALVDMLPQPPDMTALGDLELRLGSHSGGIFQQLTISGQMAQLYSTERPSVYFRMYDESSKGLPLTLFGLPGDKSAIKRELVQYIIEADKKAQQLAAWSRAANEAAGYRGSRRFQVEGDDFLFRLILGLSYTPDIARYAVPDFSVVEYRKTVIDVLQQLLEIADTSLVNNGTYASVLDSALSVISNVEQTYGLVDSDQAELAAAAVQLQRTINHRMMKGLSWMSYDEENANACTIFLSPNPWRTMRGYR